MWAAIRVGTGVMYGVAWILAGRALAPAIWPSTVAEPSRASAPRIVPQLTGARRMLSDAEAKQVADALMQRHAAMQGAISARLSIAPTGTAQRPARLLGTGVGSPDTGFALLQMHDGREVLVRRGASVDGLIVAEVRPGSVLLTNHDGTQFELKLEDPKDLN